MSRFTANPVRTISILIIDTFALAIMALLLSGLEITNLLAACAFAIALGLLNALIRPTLIAITMPVTILSLGFFSLIINGLLIVLAANILPGVRLGSFGSAIWLSVGVTIINTFFTSLFAIDDVESYEHYAIRANKRNHSQEKSEKPGVTFLEIDGLSLPVLQRAIQNGYMPNLARWVRSTHHLVGWECDLSAATPASQAGLLLGNNQNMPAFRWFDRKEQRLVSLSNMNDAYQVEQSQATSPGLLADDGVSVNNMFSGGAQTAILTASTLSQKGKVAQQSGLYYFFANPYNFSRAIILFFIDIIYELKDKTYQKRQGVWPRLALKRSYPFIRASTTILMRDMAVYTVIGKMLEGVSSLYATFVAYDEVAHHSGVERSQAMYILSKLDKEIAKIERAVAFAPRPYHLVILSDHGQSQGPTFKQRYDITLEDLVRQYASEHSMVATGGDADESWERVNSLLTDIAIPTTSAGKVMDKIVGDKKQNGVVDITPHDTKNITVEDIDVSVEDNFVVLASGNLGLIYVTGTEERLSYEQIQQRFPKLIAGLVAHEGIDFVMVNSETNGGMIIGKDGTLTLETDAVQGKNPLQQYSPNAKTHLLRANGFTNAPDILVNSLYDPSTDEVAAFEELIGSHGGLGGNQTTAFVMYPKALEPEFLTGMVGCEAVHKQLKQWTTQAGKGLTAI